MALRQLTDEEREACRKLAKKIAEKNGLDVAHVLKDVEWRQQIGTLNLVPVSYGVLKAEAKKRAREQNGQWEHILLDLIKNKHGVLRVDFSKYEEPAAA